MLPWLSNSNSTADELRFTFLCLGQFSGAAQVYLGENGHRKIEDRVKNIGERWLVLSETEIAQRWKLFASFLNCIVKFIEVRQKILHSQSILYSYKYCDILCVFSSVTTKLVRNTWRFWAIYCVD